MGRNVFKTHPPTQTYKNKGRKVSPVYLHFFLLSEDLFLATSPVAVTVLISFSLFSHDRESSGCVLGSRRQSHSLCASVSRLVSQVAVPVDIPTNSAVGVLSSSSPALVTECVYHYRVCEGTFFIVIL